MNFITSRFPWLFVMRLYVCSTPLYAVVIDDFEYDDGIPIHVISMGQFQSSFDTALPNASTIGTARVSNARAFVASDRFEISVNNPKDNSSGSTRIQGFMGDTTSTSNRPGGGMIWDGSTDFFSDNDNGLAPLDLTSEIAFRLNFSEVTGEAWVWFNVVSSTGLVTALTPPNFTVTEAGVLDFPFSDLIISPFPPDLSEVTVNDVLQSVGAITLNFRSSIPGSFDMRLEAVETVSIPEPCDFFQLVILAVLGWGSRGNRVWQNRKNQHRILQESWGHKNPGVKS